MVKQSLLKMEEVAGRERQREREKLKREEYELTTERQ